ncbi:efflux RND transporter periplasmic adaptor subunit [Candidatus Chloroploca sp. Khr17]|uniref:HlyD family secretion protein n=1 Tax=Candidatus Chloroploca sp. Khr17 TaxID=2496869 RepID=UPI001F0EB5FC|nr:efflux RND transporter periplasmic adaptor subunit [Candidatus Chloroploca sp. Khr17]
MLRKLVLSGMAAALLAGCATTAQPESAATPVPTIALPASSTGSSPAQPDAEGVLAAPTAAPLLALGVTASGEIAPKRSASLLFRVPGTVAEVMVEEGMSVREGQELIRLDVSELELALRQAEAGLAQAQAGYERLVEGATPEEVAAARAQVAQAQAGLRQTTGSVTSEDIAAAEAALASALARQAEVAAGPRTPDLQQAEAGVAQARANLEVQRTNLSAAKTNAQLQLDIAANGLRDAQQAYSDIYWRNRETELQLSKFGLEIPQEALDAEQQTLRAVQNAETRFAQAQLAYDQTTQNEVEGIRAAEASVANAEASLQRLLDGATAEQRAAVDAQVAQARASLDRLRGDQRAGSLDAARAGVAAAQANLARATSDPTAATLAGSLAQVEQARAAVESAQLNLGKTVLRAPFDGTIAIVNVEIGDSVGGAGLPVVQIVDVSELRVEVSVSDTDVARVREGMPATVTLDAIPGQTFTGNVSFIAPTATVVGNVRTFAVRITLDEQTGLRAGMSARVTIQLDG